MCSSQIIHTRSYSESKADAVDDWSSSDSPPNVRKYLSEIRLEMKICSFYLNFPSSEKIDPKFFNLNLRLVFD